MVLAEALTEAQLLETLMEKPTAMWAFILARFGPIAVGLGLAIALLIKRQDRKTLGQPAPPMARVTVPFRLAEAGALLAAGFFILPAVALYLVTGGDLDSASLWVRVGAMSAGTLPVAILVVLRRQRMRLQALDNDERVDEVFGDGDSTGRLALITGAPTKPPRMGKAFKQGMGAVCLALLVSTPVAIAWTFLIQAITGEMPALQGLVQDALDPNATYEPWLIAGYGVLVAPFVEEALFRGLLYPALQQTMLATGSSAKRATWISAIVVSALFAAVHGNWLALAPLFVLAMVLTWLLQRTNSLAACVIAHAAHNAFAMVPVLVLKLA